MRAQAASNGAIDPGIIVPAQPGELSPAPSPSNPFQKPYPFNISVADLVKDILEPAHLIHGNAGGPHLFEAKPADGKDENGYALPEERLHPEGRLGRL